MQKKKKKKKKNPLKRSRSTQGYHFSNFIGLMSPMSHTKSQARLSFGSEEEDF